MKLYRIYLFIALLLLSCLVSGAEQPAEKATKDPGSSKSVTSLKLEKNRPFHPELSVDVGLGFPDLLSGRVIWTGFNYFDFGFAAGSLPLNAIVSKIIDDYSYTISRYYKIDAEPDLTVLSMLFFARYFPWKRGLYASVQFAFWKIGADVNAVLHYNRTGREMNIGTLDFSLFQPMLAAGVGWFKIWKSGLLLDAGVGVNFLLRSSVSTKLKGVLPDAITMVPSFETAVTSGAAMLERDLRSTFDRLKEDYWVFPMVYFRMGWAFDFL